ncbi:hypothetical protein APHAL10511_006938 [Amanita phalloides]|nr:hypothetical protein APHAL10511_006938 [Amanita phalloides]
MMLDMMTFVSSVRYFAVITVETYKTYSFRGGQPWTDFFDPNKPEEMNEFFSGSRPSSKFKEPIIKEYYSGKDVIGVAYLTMPPESRNNADGVNDLNVGLIVHPDHRRKGYASQAMRLVLDQAFKTIRCHRVQAMIMDPFTHSKYPAYRFFTCIGFRQEGVRRRSYYNPFQNEYQDIAYLAILDTEWLTAQQTGMTPWDELLHRHDVERAMIMRWEGRMEGEDDSKTVTGAVAETETETETEAETEEAGTEERTETEEERTSSRASTSDFYIDSSESENWELLDDGEEYGAAV